MTRTRIALLGIVGVAAVVAALRFGWVDDYRELTVLLAGVAAVGAVAGALITLSGNKAAKATAEYVKRLADQQEQAAADIRRLAELTESSLEEARAQRPEPIVRWVVGEERRSVTEAVVERKRLRRTIDIERITAAERRRLLSTSSDEDADSQTERQSLLALAALRSLAPFAREPLTEEGKAEYERDVDAYIRELKRWIASYEEWRRTTDLSFRADVRFENRGRVPAHGVRVRLRFPDGFAPTSDSKYYGEPPDPPRLRRPASGLAGLAGLRRELLKPGLSSAIYDARRLRETPSRRNVSSPRYRDGSLLVDFEIQKLRHGIPEDSPEPLLLSAEEDGEFTVAWEIHAENLAMPATGELRITITTEEEDGPPITSLQQLMAVVRRKEPSDDE